MAKVRSSAAPAQNLARGKRGRVGRPRNALAEAAILRTAMELFVECGMEGATMEQIARARVARTTIYRRWSTRGDGAKDCR